MYCVIFHENFDFFLINKIILKSHYYLKYGIKMYNICLHVFLYIIRNNYFTLKVF
jgi:hypothetical protein